MKTNRLAASIAAREGERYRTVVNGSSLISMWILFGFLIGACVGSFLNVCILRMPLEESIVLPGSHCRHCGAGVRPWDNIPILSFLILRGRCRDCGERFSSRYVGVELFTAVVFALAFGAATPSLLMGQRLFFLCALIVVTLVDLDHQIIPDRITLPGMAVGLGCATYGLGISLGDSVAGLLLGGGMLYTIAVGYHSLTGVEGMGGGDIKLLAMIGAFLGWRSVLITLLLASSAGALYGAFLVLRDAANSRVPIPFGPFLAVGAACAMLFGEDMVDWYLNSLVPL